MNTTKYCNTLTIYYNFLFLTKLSITILTLGNHDYLPNEF